MNLTKSTIVAVAVLILAGGGSALAFDHRGPDFERSNYESCPCYDNGMGERSEMRGGRGSIMGRGRHHDQSSLTAEQREEFREMRQNFEKTLDPKMQSLDAKTMELRALSNNPNAKPEQIQRLSQEIAALRVELRQLHRDFSNQMYNKFSFE